ncbi:MAG TPA: SH3 domain-containing protein [Chloroflexia bacterium]|nr:SH3 domain-containing protein [Chloroflexia bacterium]
MSQQPPEWWGRPRGARIGCADVTIVSIASIAAFIILIFVLLRSDFAKVVDVFGNGNPTVGAVRPTDTAAPVAIITPGQADTTASTPAPTTAAAAPAAPPTNTPAPTPAFRRGNLKDSCNLRQEASVKSTTYGVFSPGTAFKLYSETRSNEGKTWIKVEPDDGTGRVGWMWQVECFGSQ